MDIGNYSINNLHLLSGVLMRFLWSYRNCDIGIIFIDFIWDDYFQDSVAHKKIQRKER